MVGLTVIAYGTSLPEFVVSVLASRQGVADFAAGNIVGSNVANIGLVLGVAAVIHPISLKSELSSKARPSPSCPRIRPWNRILSRWQCDSN